MKAWFGSVLIGAMAVASACATAQPAPASSAEVAAPKNVYVTRHLQKGEGDDPSLTAEGSANAEKLAAMLADKGITAIFVTPTRRTTETATPLAKRLGITITTYDPRDPDALVKAVAAAPGPVLVVGHSNTVPDLVARFGGQRPAPMSEEDFGTLFVVEPDGTVAATEVR
ncbi:MAG TPA: histidine phosphatase family protein [Sphingomicrobium sp.]|nr:histidine phosphatase family protein [Sphingomicrobium sp.]